MPADWLSDYAVLYRYNETDHDMIAAEFVELTGLIRRAVESVIAHIFRISGVDPAPPNLWPAESRSLPSFPRLSTVLPAQAGIPRWLDRAAAL